MLTMLTIMAILAAQEPAKKQDEWYQKVVAKSTPEARKKYAWSSKSNVIQSVVHADPTLYIFDGVRTRVMTAEEKAAYDSRARENARRFGEVDQYFGAHDLLKARRLLEGMMQEDDLQFLATLKLAEVTALERKYAEVIDLLAPFVNDALDERGLLLLAYASANIGQVYEGQSEFCEARIRRGTTTITQDMPILAKSDKAIAALALGWDTDYFEIASRYLTQTLVLEPSNPLANWSLAKIFEARKQNYLALQKYELAASFGGAKLKVSAEINVERLRNRIAWEAAKAARAAKAAESGGGSAAG